MAQPLWRQMLVPAFFRFAPFHVDVNARASGRRIVLHQFPKRDAPYAEDMGRAARHFAVTGYVIGPAYIIEREALVAALEMEGAGMLILPTLLQRDSILCVVQSYSVRETRQAGGMAEFDMQFVEAGEQGFASIIDSIAGSLGAAGDLLNNAVGALNGALGGGGTGPVGPGTGASDPGGTVEIGEIEIGPGVNP